MNKPVSLDQGIEGAIYEIVEVVDGELSKEIGAYKGMSAVVLKKALQKNKSTRQYEIFESAWRLKIQGGAPNVPKSL